MQRTSSKAALVAIVIVSMLVVGAVAYANRGGEGSDPSAGGAVTVPGGDGSMVHDVPSDEPIVEPEPQVVEPRPGMAGTYARAFDSATIGADDRTLTIDFVGGVEPCYVLDRVEVTYGADAVTVTLYDGHEPGAGEVACIDIGILERVIVELDEPLGGRAIVDGAAR